MSSVSGREEDVLQWVNQFWSMLDDLSENDSAAYRKFIEGQLRKGSEFGAAPELHSCVRTQILVSYRQGFHVTQRGERRYLISTSTQGHLEVFATRNRPSRNSRFMNQLCAVMVHKICNAICELRKDFIKFPYAVDHATFKEPKPGLLYINICSWKRVSAPQSQSCALPMCGGKLETGTREGQGWYAVLDVALNPAAIQESKEDKADINKVYKLALSFAQQQHGMRLSQEYSVVNCCPKSNPHDLYCRLGFQMQHNTSKQTETDIQTPASLLRQISSQQSERQDEDFTAQIVCSPAENKKEDLIQVISSTSVEPQKPEYQLEVKTDRTGVPRSVELTVELPKVRSMSECQLRVSEDDVLLEVGDVYFLLLELPTTVNEDTASAIFNKKKQRLTLTLDVL